jgi:hypothetical protein
MSNYQNQNQNSPAKVKSILNESKLRLSKPVENEKGKYSSLQFSIHNNQPRITVWTGYENDKSQNTGYGKIEAALDIPHMYILIELIREAAAAKEATKSSLECKNYIFNGGKKSSEPLLQTTVYVGKDDKGIVYISLIAYNKDRPKIKFDFNINKFYHTLKNNEGAVMSADVASVTAAKGWCRLLENIIANVATNGFVDNSERNKNAYNDRTNNYSKNNNNNSRSSEEDSGGGKTYEDDDIPF